MYRLNYFIKLIILSILLSLIFLELSAQDDTDKRENIPQISERLFFGGTLGLQFGTYTHIEASPLLGFWLLPRVAVAVGRIYKYIKDPVGATGVWGGKGFVRLLLI